MHKTTYEANKTLLHANLALVAAAKYATREFEYVLTSGTETTSYYAACNNACDTHHAMLDGLKLLKKRDLWSDELGYAKLEATETGDNGDNHLIEKAYKRIEDALIMVIGAMVNIELELAP